MKTNVEINSLVQAAVDERLIKKAAAAVIAGEAGHVSDSRAVEVSIVIVGPKMIRRINKKYRKKDRVTDVLSFAEEDTDQSREHPRILGELVICAKQVKDDAKEAGVSAEYELAWVTVHGTLHLFGYDHETNEADAVLMRQKEKKYLSQIKFKSTKQKA